LDGRQLHILYDEGVTGVFTAERIYLVQQTTNPTETKRSEWKSKLPRTVQGEDRRREVDKY
jgi:hypothetical protein